MSRVCHPETRFSHREGSLERQGCFEIRREFFRIYPLDLERLNLSRVSEETYRETRHAQIFYVRRFRRSLLFARDVGLWRMTVASTMLNDSFVFSDEIQHQ
ncbi:hypothetical protein K0M31_000821 [Melipona bicolor]|uniref:Uncharacterized protein n=1 Tax=Melipona bicolor TaxID=60889 RepID=A0AA40GE98_9HYME|nr:hypothetical protein K0M31_000821 [Melipona bicolor]